MVIVLVLVWSSMKSGAMRVEVIEELFTFWTLVVPA